MLGRLERNSQEFHHQELQVGDNHIKVEVIVLLQHLQVESMEGLEVKIYIKWDIKKDSLINHTIHMLSHTMQLKRQKKLIKRSIIIIKRKKNQKRKNIKSTRKKTIQMMMTQKKIRLRIVIVTLILKQRKRKRRRRRRERSKKRKKMLLKN